jgi:1-hydroxycarotenoid 3,4-desaturase
MWLPSGDVPVVVVGAGVAGLTAAIELAAAGLRVTVLEASEVTGGKLRSVPVAGRDVDAGPTVLSMRWVFDELFARAGRDLDSYVVLEPAQVLARHTWPDGRTLDLFADPTKSRDAIAAAFGEREGDGFARFCRDTRRIYQVVEEPFLRSQRPTLVGVMRHATRIGLPALLRIDAARSMWRALGSYFGAPQLLQLFGRYATYCGSSPFEAPATLNLVAHVEACGVHRVRGGMSQLAAALERVARELGVDIVCGARVDRIETQGGRVTGVHPVGGGVIAASAVVLNADVSALASGLLGERLRDAAPPTAAGDRSLSALTWAVVGLVEGRALMHHNVFFSDDYAAEFHALFRQRRCPDDPTVYVCAQDRGDDDDPRGSERLLLIINAPATGDEPRRWAHPELERCEETTFRTLERCGARLRPEAAMVRTSPHDFASRYPGTGGALYGPASRGALSAFTRSGARTRVAGLYMAGGSVHPGPGVPMASLSGRLAAEALRSDLGSMGRSRRAATSGSISTD